MSINTDSAFLSRRARANFFFGSKSLYVGDKTSSWVPILSKLSESFVVCEAVDEAKKFEDETFDFIFVYRQNLAFWFLEDLFRMLKPSGRIYFSFLSKEWFIANNSMDITNRLKGRNEGIASFDPADFGEIFPIEPDLFSRVAKKIGFVHIQIFREGGLVCDWLAAESVWVDEGIFEAILDKPQSLFRKFHSDFFEFFSTMRLWLQPLSKTAADLIRGAEAAKRRTYFLPSTNEVILSNASRFGYPESIVRKFEKNGKNFLNLSDLVQEICAGLAGPEARFEAILKFVQKAIYRDPLVQPLLENGTLPSPECILLTHIGRCGHISKILVRLLTEAGFEAKIWQLRNHVTVQCLVGGDWVLAEVDIFKNGILTKKGNKYLTVQEIERDPTLLDAFPATGWCYQKTVHGDDLFRGYVDNIPFSKRGFTSNFFHIGVPIFPASVVENLRYSKSDQKISWDAAQAPAKDLLYYRVLVSRDCRGWSYAEMGHAAEVLSPMVSVVLELKVEGTSVNINLEPGVYFISVFAITSQIEVNPETFFWPSEELEIHI